eukprot:1625265-Prymnesium_polylepis.1
MGSCNAEGRLLHAPDTRCAISVGRGASCKRVLDTGALHGLLLEQSDGVRCGCDQPHACLWHAKVSAIQNSVCDFVRVARAVGFEQRLCADRSDIF